MSYIFNWNEFRFYDGVKEAMKTFGEKFGKIIVISNQRGVGRELMTEDDLKQYSSENGSSNKRSRWQDRQYLLLYQYR